MALPRYDIPSRTYFRKDNSIISEKIIPLLYETLVQKKQILLEETDFISVTSDMWTCLHNDISFISFTAHWITLNMKHFEGQHTAHNIANALQEIPSLWDISLAKIHIVVYDNRANIVKAVSDAGLDSACCFIHILQLVIRDSRKMQSKVEKTIAMGRRIVTTLTILALHKKN